MSSLKKRYEIKEGSGGIKRLMRKALSKKIKPDQKVELGKRMNKKAFGGLKRLFQGTNPKRMKEMDLFRDMREGSSEETPQVLKRNQKQREDAIKANMAKERQIRIQKLLNKYHSKDIRSKLETEEKSKGIQEGSGGMNRLGRKFDHHWDAVNKHLDLVGKDSKHDTDKNFNKSKEHQAKQQSLLKRMHHKRAEGTIRKSLQGIPEIDAIYQKHRNRDKISKLTKGIQRKFNKNPYFKEKLSRRVALRNNDYAKSREDSDSSTPLFKLKQFALKAQLQDRKHKRDRIKREKGRIPFHPDNN